MSGIRDTATVTLNVNGVQAKRMIQEISQELEDAKKNLVDLQAKGADPGQLMKARKNIRRLENQLADFRSATEGVNKALQNLDSSTPRELEKAFRHLNKTIKSTRPGSEEWKELSAQLRTVKARLADVREELSAQQSPWEKFKGFFSNFSDVYAGWLGLRDISDAVIGSLRGFVDEYAQMDQEMANVRKFTGMTEEQVASLNEEFKKMDTRTPREGLNQLAQEAGRLGKTSEEDVLGFVRAADKINVALDDLGEGATLTLSKLTGIFGDEAKYGTEESLLKVGSVINELSQNCSASASYISEFTERLGGVGAQAGMTIPQIMGFAAVLDTNAQKVEASSTALSQIIVRLYQDPAKYAKVAGLEVEAFSKLMREDANAALIQLLEALQEAGGMDSLSPMFKDMGEKGSRAIAALSTLATHIDAVKTQQEAANVAFEDGTSVGEEYSVQNNTVQAGLEKYQNAVHELRVELGQYLEPIMGRLLNTGASIMSALLSTIKFVVKHKAGVIALTAAFVAYNVALQSTTILTNIHNGLLKARALLLKADAMLQANLAVVTEGLRLVYLRLTGQLRQAAIQQKAFATAMASTPWGAILSAIGAAVAAFVMFDEAVSDAVDSENALKSAQAEAVAKMAEERAALNANIEKTKSFNGTKEEERLLIQQLNDKYGQVFGTYNTVAEWYDTLITKGEAWVATLGRQIIVEGKLAYARELIAKAEKLRTEGKEINYTDTDNFNEWFGYNLKALLEIIATGGKAYKSMDDFLNEAVAHNRYESNQEADYYTTLANAVIAEAIAEGEAIQAEIAGFRSKSKPQENPVPKTPAPTPVSSPVSSENSDRFASEKKLKEKEEASMRILYARGQRDYLEYRDGMLQIELDFYTRQLEHTDISETERLQILAQYAEAEKKQREEAAAGSLAELQLLHDMEIADISQRYINGQYCKETYDEAMERAEIEHLENLVKIYEDGSKEKLKAETDLQNALMSQKQKKQQKEQEAERKLAEMKTKYFGMSSAEKEAAYKSDLALLQQVYDHEIEAAGNNADEKLRIEEAFLQAQQVLREQYGQQGAETAKNGLRQGVEASVEWLDSDGGKAMTGAFSTVTQGMASIFSALSSVVSSELEIQTAAIEKKYSKEVYLAQGNSYKVAKLEKNKEAEIAKAKREANRKMFAMQVIQAVAQTATNALNAYGSAAAVPVIGYILAPIAAAMAIAAGAIQIAAIKKQQQASEAQGYAEGGFTRPGGKYEPAGVVHAGEWVASQELVNSPTARPLIDALDYAQRTNTIGTLRAEDVSRAITAPNAIARMSESDGGSALMAAVASQMSSTVDRLTERLNEPFVTVNTVTGDAGIKQAQDEYTRLINNVTPKSRRK